MEGLLSSHPLAGALDLDDRLAAWDRKQVVLGRHELLGQAWDSKICSVPLPGVWGTTEMQ